MTEGKLTLDTENSITNNTQSRYIIVDNIDVIIVNIDNIYN